MDRGAWWTIVHGVVEMGMTQQLSTAQYSFPGGSNCEESACKVGDLGSISGSQSDGVTKHHHQMPDNWLLMWCNGKKSACQSKRLRRCRFKSWVGKIPWRKKWQPSLVFLLGKFHGQRSLLGYSPQGRTESDRTG